MSVPLYLVGVVVGSVAVDSLHVLHLVNHLVVHVAAAILLLVLLLGVAP